MKNYIKQRITNTGKKWTREQKQEIVRSMFEILQERGYSFNRSGELIAKTITERMHELKDILDKSLIYFEEEGKRRKHDER